MSEYSPEELDFIELANTVRRVRTIEGSKFYDLPIGAIITADIIRAKNEEAKAKGIKPPKGALSKVSPKDGSATSGSKSSSSSPKTPSPSKKATPSSAPKTPAQDGAKSQGSNLKKDPLTGPKKFKLGESEFSAPVGSKLIRSKKYPVAYVVTPDDEVHIFNPDGEVDYDEGFKEVLKESFKNLGPDNPNFTESEFDADTPLSDQAVGATLQKNGQVFFKKTGKNSWANEELGIVMGDKELQNAVDSGKFELVSGSTVEGNDFSNMSSEQVEEALEELPAGKKLIVNDITVTKQENGNWKSSATEQEVPSKNIADMHDAGVIISDAPDEEADLPDSSEEDSEAPVDSDPVKDAVDADSTPEESVEPVEEPQAEETPEVEEAPELEPVELDMFEEWANLPEPPPEKGKTVESLEGLDSVYLKLNPGVSVTLNRVDDDTWTDESFGSIWKEEDLQEDLKAGNFWVADDGEDSSTSPIQIGSTESKSTATGETGGSFTKAEIEEAIDILENFTGKSFKHELNKKGSPLGKLSPNHIVGFNKDKTVTKQKFIDLLKKKIDGGEETSADLPEAVEVEPAEEQTAEDSESTVPKVNVGSRMPKDTPTGTTGGEFTAEEIQEAVDILESFTGKSFKHELNKKGSPLGKLSPNHIVGFNKDKTVTKQKFIDLLKKKIDGGEVSESTVPEDTPTETTGGEVTGKSFEHELNKDSVPEIELTDEFSEEEIGVFLQDLDLSSDLKVSKKVTDFIREDKFIQSIKQLRIDNDLKKLSLGHAKIFSEYLRARMYEKDSKGVDLKTAKVAGKKLTAPEMFALDEGSIVEVKNDFGIISTWTKSGSQTFTNEKGVERYKDSFVPFALYGDMKYIGDEKSSTEEVDTEEVTHGLISDPGAKKIGSQAGSNPGGLYELPMSDGTTKKFYVKKAQTADHGRSETLANVLYQELGSNAPNVNFDSDGNIYSEIVEGTHNMPEKLSSQDSEWLDSIRKDYVIDAWLANRDVFGLTYDNILTDSEGKPWKIDNGGSLFYRAQGAKKTDFTADEVPELDIFRTGKKSAIFGEGVMTLEQEMDGVNRLAKISPERISELVEEHNMDSEVADILIGRRKVILDRYKVKDPYATPDEIAAEFDPETSPVGTVLHSVGDLEKVPSGGVIRLDLGDKTSKWVKKDDGKFTDSAYLTSLSPDIFKFAAGGGKISWEGMESNSDQVNKLNTPESLESDEPKKVTWNEFVDKPSGYEMVASSGKAKYIKKSGPGQTTVVSITAMGTVEEFDLDSYSFNVLEASSPFMDPGQKDYPNGITPGKYTTGKKGAKTALWVKSDGTGYYQGMKGVVKELDIEGVKKNYDAGMSNLVSPVLNEEDYPNPSAGKDSVLSSTPKKGILGLGSVDTLPDGTYVDAQGTTYKVSGDKVEVSKVLKKMDFSELSVGKVPDSVFKTNAPVGTVLRFQYSKSDNPGFIVKDENGEWKPLNGESYWDKNALSYSSYIDSFYSWAHNKWKIHSFPETDDSTVSKASIKTKYLKGQLIDPKTQTSVYPPGYSGAVTFFGGATDTASLHALSTHLADADIPASEKANAPLKYGVPVKAEFWKTHLTEKHGPDAMNSGEETVQLFKQSIDEFLASANLPEVIDTSKLFNYDENGNVVKPASIAALNTLSWYAKTGEWSDRIKAISATVGDGNVIGVNMAGATKDQKVDWVSFYNQGAFSDMYELEVSVAKNKGKPHPSGTAHPGHPNNTSTHNITWGPAVPGEIPAGTEIPGEWSSLGVDASVEEINNYLIAAKMQNPTYLGLSEKRAWVNNHRKGNKSTVDQFSALALSRKEKGDSPYSDPPVWTDNVKPAKSYDSMFDDTQFPQNWADYPNYVTKAPDFYNEVVGEEPELEGIFEQLKTENPYSDQNGLKAMALNSWFAAKENAYLEELNKPEWEIFKSISEGSHPTFIIKDKKSDKMKIFKPITAGKEWRAENEVAAHNLGAMFGFNVPKASIGEVNEGLPPGVNNKGIIMDFAPNVGSMGNVDGAEVDLSTLTPKQFGQLASEHVFDWFLDNDDTHDENILIGEDGSLVAIDKGRAFIQFGHWNGLDVDNPQSLNINTQDSPTGRKHVVYSDMIESVKSGKISKEQLDEAYKQALKAAKRIQKSDDNTVAAFVKSASENRTDWSLPKYARNWDFLTPHPNNQDELVAGVLARKNSMVEDIETFYDKLYESVGFAKPEPPAKALGDDHLSGWEEADVISKTEEAKVWGAAPLHASAGFVGGASLLWTEKDTNGNNVVSGKFQLGNLTQEKVLGFMSSKLSPHSSVGSNAQLSEYPTAHVKSWKKTVTAVGKDITAHATDGAYNQELWNSMKTVEGYVDTDLEFAESVDTHATGKATFPSGVTIPNETVPQYVLALQYHKKLIGNVETAKAEGVGTDKAHFQDFVPPSWKIKGNEFKSPEGWTYKELEDGNYIEVKEGKASVVPDIPDGAKSGAPGWTSSVSEEDTSVTPEKYSLISAGMFAGQLGNGGEKTLQSDFNTSGHPGKEYRIDLPSGEKIFFRDGNDTGTAKSQTGTIRFQLNRTLDPETSLANVQKYLETVGVDMSGADEEQIENVYWRQQFNRIIFSAEKMDMPASVRKAREKLLGMKNSIAQKLGKYSINDSDIVEGIGLTEEDENTFWRNLAKEAFGAEKVEKFLASGGHMPRYQHMDLANPEKSTGLPWYKRIDVDLEDLYNTGALIAHGNSGKDKRHFDYIKSGAYTSTEERLRILGYYKTGASSSADQETGGANYAFTRIAKGSSATSGSIYGKHVMYWSPEVMAMTDTFSFPGDSYGNISLQQNGGGGAGKGSPYNPVDALNQYNSTGNETMIKNNVAIFDFMELMVFEHENERLKAIEEFKKLGIEKLRGLPIEDRLVLRTNLASALAKVKANWKKG